MKKALLLVAILFFTCPPGATEASDFSVSAHPALLPIQVNASESFSSEIQLTNNSEKEIRLNTKFIEFEPNKKWDGSILLPTTQPLSQTKPTLSTYITVREGENEVSSITLQPGERKTILLQINIPQQARPQDAYLTLLFEKESTNSEGVTIQPGLATNILLSIIPETTKNIHIQEFTSEQLVVDSSTSFTLLIENKGRSYTRTEGNIVIENMFGTQVEAIQLPQHFVLAGGKRYMNDKNSQKIDWDPDFLFGWYKATAHINTGDRTVTVSTHFISLPPMLITGISISLIFILGIYLRVRKKI